MGVNTRNTYSCLHKYNKLNKSHLVGQLLNSIHDARTHVHIYIYIYKLTVVCQEGNEVNKFKYLRKQITRVIGVIP